MRFAVNVESHRDAIASAREHRAGLHEALIALERRLAAPAGASAEWRTGMAEAAGDVRNALASHIETVEADDGLLAQVLADAPRLAHAVDELRSEHEELVREIEALEEHLAEADVAAVRRDALEVLGRFARHRQKGSDLVYEAYTVDIGSGD